MADINTEPLRTGRPPARRPMKITFFGHFGSLNSGNESTFLAVLSRLQSMFPDSEFCCVCTNPSSVIARDSIDAVPISVRRFRVRNHQARLSRRLKVAALAVHEEFTQYLRAFKTLEGTDVLIVPGTGVLTDAYGLSDWGPYNLFKWTLLAKLRRCRVLFVSVGAGPLDRPLGRLLAKSALALADYRSYRDEASRRYLERIGFDAKNDRVYPDLVFDLPTALLPPSNDGNEPRLRRVVGLGLMSYAGKYSVVNPSDKTYAAYLDALVVFVEWLLDHDYDIRLLLGDEDAFVIDDFTALLQTRLGAYDKTRVVDTSITSVDEILAELSATDVVVATRFHNVLLSLILNKPVVAISFHHKCTSLMEHMGLTAYCHDIHHIDAPRLIAQFQQLESNREDVKHRIERSVRESRKALDEQYDLLFGDFESPRRV